MLFVFGSGLSHCLSSPLFYRSIPTFCCCVTPTLAVLSISPTQGTETKRQNGQYTHHIAKKNEGPLPPTLYVNSECPVFVTYLTPMTQGSERQRVAQHFKELLSFMELACLVLCSYGIQPAEPYPYYCLRYTCTVSHAVPSIESS